MRYCSIVLILIGVAAFLFRVPRLDERPLHTDEAVHTYNFSELLETGKYIYSPRDYHGPTIYYFALPFVLAEGAHTYRDIKSVFPFRIVPVIFGSALILLLIPFKDGIGRKASIVAAILTAVSPAMVFYSRYYIQQMLLVFFSFGGIVAGWRYTRGRRIGWALLCGVCIGLMHATKETCIIAYWAMLGSGVLTVIWTRWMDKHRLHLPDYMHHWHVVGALKTAAVVSVLCLTALLSNPRATIDAILSYGDYFQRAGTGDGSTDGVGAHIHPWYYYLQIVGCFRYAGGPLWSEGVIMILALIGIGRSLKKRREGSEGNVHLLRILGFYTILMTVVYSAIPYKTPWCMLGFLHGMILTAGVGASALWEWACGARRRIAVCVVLLAAAGHLGFQAYRGSYVYYADPRNPYVYAHTSTDILRLVDRIEGLSKVHPDGSRMTVNLIAPGSDYWPLPWYLRRFEMVKGFDTVPADADAAVIAAVSEPEDKLDSVLRGSYFKEVYGLRPGVLMTVYIESSLWDRFIESRK